MKRLFYEKEREEIQIINWRPGEYLTGKERRRERREKKRNNLKHS